MGAPVSHSTITPAPFSERRADIQEALALKQRIAQRVTELKQIAFETERQLLVVQNLIADYERLLDPPQEMTFDP